MYFKRQSPEAKWFLAKFIWKHLMEIALQDTTSTDLQWNVISTESYRSLYYFTVDPPTFLEVQPGFIIWVGVFTMYLEFDLGWTQMTFVQYGSCTHYCGPTYQLIYPSFNFTVIVFTKIVEPWPMLTSNFYKDLVLTSVVPNNTFVVHSSFALQLSSLRGISVLISDDLWPPAIAIGFLYLPSEI